MRLSIHAAIAAALVSLAFAAPAVGNDAPAPPAAPQKIADCSHDKDAKGEPKPDCDVARAPAHEAQTHKMVRCNEEAGKKQLHGDERRAFMSACLKG
jgi:psiF repeat-containing protein